MHHLFYRGKNSSKKVFVLLHGTGGNERSLIDVVNYIQEGATYVSFRGNVKEQGMNRFFKRRAEGVYDVEDLQRRSHELHEAIVAVSQEYGFELSQVVLLGFSNGANIATQLILDYPDIYKRAILMAPMFPVDTSKYNKSLAETAIFLSVGEMDPIVPIEESQHVIQLFTSRAARTTVQWTSGHHVTVEILDAVKEWLTN